MTISKLVMSRNLSWFEKNITHERGYGIKPIGVVCFGDGRSLCAFTKKWFTVQPDIEIQVIYEYSANKIRDLQASYDLQERNIIPMTVANPITDKNCRWERTSQSTQEIHCQYRLNVNLYHDTIKKKNSALPQLFKCFKRMKSMNFEKQDITCRKLLLNLLPYQQRKDTKEVIENDNSQYNL